MAIEHLKPTRANSVYGLFNSSYAGNSKNAIDRLTKEIDTYDKDLEEIQKKLEQYSDDKDAASRALKQYEEDIKQFREGEKLQIELKKLESEKNQILRNRSNQFMYIGNDFNDGKANTRFFALSLANRAIELLSKSDFSGKDIPDMHARTIKYLLKRGTCLCGTHLDEGAIPYNNLKELLNYLPPMSVGVAISNFIKETQSYYNINVALKDKLGLKIGALSSFEDDILLKQQEIDDVLRKLGGNDVSKQVRALNGKILACKTTIRQCEIKSSELLQEKGWKSKQREDNDRERTRLSLLDKQNAQIESYKAHAKALYEKFEEEYKSREHQTRQKLQTYINQNFQKLFDGGIYLTINEKYNVKVTTNDVSFQTSTAQSIAVIFAFISAIIMIQRENYNVKNDATYAEPYPLVMDAPLSALDKTRIKAICESLPKIAEQIIVFIKDTDGEIAEEHLGNKIGKKYSFIKKDNFNTKIV